MRRTKVVLIGIACSIFFIFIFLRQLIFSIDKPLNDPDIFYQYFLLEGNLKHFTTLDFGNLYETRMFYPMKNTLALGNSQFVQSLMALPAFLVTRNVIVSAHVMIFINFFLSFFTMYLLVYRLTRSVGGSLVAGLIFSYNPFVMAQFYFELLTIFWIPLIFLITESIITKPTFLKGMILPILFLFQLISSFYYIFIIAITWPVYVALRYRHKATKLLTPGFIFGLIMAGTIGYFYLRPYLEMKEKFRVTRNLERVDLHSATWIDFFAASPYNKIYGSQSIEGKIIKSLRGTALVDYYSEHFTEHSLFPGVAAYILFFISIFLLTRVAFRQQFVEAIPLFVILVVAVLISFGPSLPVYTFMYTYIPFVDSLRAPSRFAVVGLFALALMAGFAATKANKWILILIIIFITLEYQHRFFPISVRPDIREAYSWLNNQDRITVISELPMANNLLNYPNVFRSYFDDSTYLLFALYHDKKLINGNAAYNPPERTELGQALTINFPTPSKLEQLKDMGVDALVVHRNGYKDTRIADEVIEKLQKSDLRQIYTSESILIFTYE